MFIIKFLIVTVFNLEFKLRLKLNKRNLTKVYYKLPETVFNLTVTAVNVN